MQTKRRHQMTKNLHSTVNFSLALAHCPVINNQFSPVPHQKPAKSRPFILKFSQNLPHCLSLAKSGPLTTCFLNIIMGHIIPSERNPFRMKVQRAMTADELYPARIIRTCVLIYPQRTQRGEKQIVQQVHRVLQKGTNSG